jgi:hypothetical protein
MPQDTHEITPTQFTKAGRHPIRLLLLQFKREGPVSRHATTVLDARLCQGKYARTTRRDPSTFASRMSEEIQSERGRRPRFAMPSRRRSCRSFSPSLWVETSIPTEFETWPPCSDSRWISYRSCPAAWIGYLENGQRHQAHHGKSGRYNQRDAENGILRFVWNRI